MFKVEKNISLRILSMCRKEINDEKGKLIASNLKLSIKFNFKLQHF